MNARAQRAAARDALRAAAAFVNEAVDGSDEDSNASEEVPQAEAPIEGVNPMGGAPAAAAAVAPIAMDPGMWLSMVNVKPPQWVDLEIENMKKFILDYKRYAQKCPQPLLRSMQQFILDEHLDVIIHSCGETRAYVMAQDRDNFTAIMLSIHNATSSRKWRLMMKNARMEKSDLSLSTFTQYVEDWRFWLLVCGREHAVPDREMAKIFVQGLKPDIFREEISSRACGDLATAIRESRDELATYRDLLDITDEEV